MFGNLQRLFWCCLLRGLFCATVFGPLVTIGWAQTSPGTGYPVPSEPNQIFFLQRSMNSNTIVYAVRLDSDLKLDRRDPVEIFWRRFNDNGERLPITFAERNLAFGVRTKPLQK